MVFVYLAFFDFFLIVLFFSLQLKSSYAQPRFLWAEFFFFKLEQASIPQKTKQPLQPCLCTDIFSLWTTSLSHILFHPFRIDKRLGLYSWSVKISFFHFQQQLAFWNAHHSIITVSEIYFPHLLVIGLAVCKYVLELARVWPVKSPVN